MLKLKIVPGMPKVPKAPRVKPDLRYEALLKLQAFKTLSHSNFLTTLGTPDFSSLHPSFC